MRTGEWAENREDKYEKSYITGAGSSNNLILRCMFQNAGNKRNDRHGNCTCSKRRDISIQI